jgi:hypothetical protein
VEETIFREQGYQLVDDDNDYDDIYNDLMTQPSSGFKTITVNHYSFIHSGHTVH